MMLNRVDATRDRTGARAGRRIPGPACPGASPPGERWRDVTVLRHSLGTYGCRSRLGSRDVDPPQGRPLVPELRHDAQLPDLYGGRSAPAPDTVTMTHPIQPGQVLKIPEAHYLYGLGDLMLRLTEVGTVQRMPDGDWLKLKGVQLAWNGTELKERQVLVRLSGLTKRRGRP